jgi:hypothetical protein
MADEFDAEPTVTPPSPNLDRQSRRRWDAHVAWALFRAALAAVVLVTIYYLFPFTPRSGWVTVLELAVGLSFLVGLITWQVRSIVRSRYPGIRAIESLATTTPLFLLLFAATYYVMSQAGADTFSETLTRTDSLYFTVTLFSTVGLGDITPQTQVARLLVTGQMILDLVILGIGLRLFIGAVNKGRVRQGAAPFSAEP